MTSLGQLVVTGNLYIKQYLLCLILHDRLHRSSIPSYITSIPFIIIYYRLRAWCLCGWSFALAFIIIMSSVLRVYLWNALYVALFLTKYDESPSRARGLSGSLYCFSFGNLILTRSPSVKSLRGFSPFLWL